MLELIDRTAPRALIAGGLAAALALGLAACGSGSGTVSGASGIKAPPGVRTPQSESLTGGIRGGTLTVLNHEDFEHLDPGQAYFSVDYEAIYATQRPLYSYKPNTFAAPTPDMASGPPEISSNRETVTVHIRSGVRFSPPVNREVTSADVAYAIDRGANPNVPILTSRLTSDRSSVRAPPRVVQSPGSPRRTSTRSCFI